MELANEQGQSAPHNTNLLGQIGLDGSTSALQPRLDIKINAIGPAAYEPARAVPYLGTAKRGVTLNGPTEQLSDQATAIAESIFPDSHFSYLGAGRYGVVLAE